MHGSIRVPCWEPIRWKPWERSEPYVSLPACNRPSVGRGPYFSSHTLPKHTHTETHNRMYSMQRLYTNCHFPVSGATHFQVALLLSSCLDVWGFDKMSKASKNDFTTEKGSGQEKKSLDSVCLTLWVTFSSWRNAAIYIRHSLDHNRTCLTFSRSERLHLTPSCVDTAAVGSRSVSLVHSSPTLMMLTKHTYHMRPTVLHYKSC